MKPTAGRPRARQPVPRKPVQLNLRRTPTWPEEDEASEQTDSHFWRWFAVVLLLHLVAFIVLLIVFHRRTPPPQQFINIVPAGEMVRGTPGVPAAPKIAPTTPAPSHAEVTPTPPPAPVTPPKPKPHPLAPVTPKPPPILDNRALVTAPPVKPKPKPPKPPKIKVDLSLQDAPDTDDAAPAPPPKIKPKAHPKKPSHPVDAAAASSTSENQTQGLSREEAAQRLADKLKTSGVDQSDKTGVNGSEHSSQNDFSDFYQAIHDQVMNKWSVPNLVDPAAVDPVVQIHVEKDGRVPAERVTLLRSSNNPAFDQSALEAARAMGYTLQPLPDSCPPDISITFNLRQQ